MQVEPIKAPLAGLRGVRPQAPAWFELALQMAPHRSVHMVRGAAIEMLLWGELGRPGILFLHGRGAHADWWSFIAPFFAHDHRVAAMSWSGMGGSDWRASYSLDLFVEEAFSVAQAAGLFAGTVPPVFVGHSFGGFPLVACAARRGGELRAAIIVDTPFLPPDRAKRHPGFPRPRFAYPTVESAVQRFRLLPAQPCENLFIVDFIARASLKSIAPGTEEGSVNGSRPAFTWRFDPSLWQRYHASNPVADLQDAKCPIAILRGAKSTVVTEESTKFVRSVVPASSPVIDIPEAHHHVMLDQPLAFVATLRALLSGWAV